MRWTEAPLDDLIALVTKGVPREVAAARLKIAATTLRQWVFAGKENIRARALDPDVELTEHGLFVLELNAAELAVDDRAYQVVARHARKDPAWAWRWIKRRDRAEEQARAMSQTIGPRTTLAGSLAESEDLAAMRPPATYDEVRGKVMETLLGK